MRIVTVSVLLLLSAAPALADGYPVSGRWGAVTSASDGPVDCSNKRVIEFNGAQRSDSNGGVPSYRVKSVAPAGPGQWRVTDQFTTGQIHNGSVSYTLKQADADHLELQQQKGGTLKLQKCK